jgi:hypothetical protein
MVDLKAKRMKCIQYAHATSSDLNNRRSESFVNIVTTCLLYMKIINEITTKNTYFTD